MDDQMEIADCTEPASGFMQKLCQFSVPQDTIPANSSLIAASSLTGAVLDHDHSQISLTSPCFWVSWSPDGALAAVAVVCGDVLVYSAADLLVHGTTQPICSFHQKSIRQITWSSCSSSLYVVDSSRRLSVRSLGAGGASDAVELQTEATAISTEGDLVAYGHGISEKPELCICKHDGQMKTLLTHSVIMPGGWACIIDSIAFISPTALVLELLAVDASDPEGSSASPSEEVVFSVVVLDDALHPTAVTHDMLGPERFHNHFEPIPSQHTGGPPKASRAPLTGPFMTAATFPYSFPAAVVCSALLHELHFIHLFFTPVASDESQLDWHAVLNSIDALKLNLPGADQSGTQVANYVIGTAPFSSKPGITVHHTLDGLPAAEDVPQVLFLMSGGQLVVANIGTFEPQQLHASVVKPPVAAARAPFSAAPQSPAAASSPPEHTPVSLGLQPGPVGQPAAAHGGVARGEDDQDSDDQDSDPDYRPSPAEEEGSTSSDDDAGSVAPSELPSDPPVYQDADATENAPATIQGMHVLPSEELDDGDSEWNDENVEDMENATPAQHRASSGSQLQPLEPAAVPHVGHGSARVREASQQGSASSQSPLQPMALPHPALPHPGAQQEPFPLPSPHAAVPETPESSDHGSTHTMPTTLHGGPPLPSTAGSIWDRSALHAGGNSEYLGLPAAAPAAPFGSRPAGSPLAVAGSQTPAVPSDGNELAGPIVSLNGGVAGLDLRPWPSLGSEGSTAASVPVPPSVQQDAGGSTRVATQQEAGAGCVGDAVDGPMEDSLCEPEQPAILMSEAPDLSHHLPVHEKESSIVASLERELQKLPAVPGAEMGSGATDSKKMFEAELDSIRHLLAEVRAAVRLSATCGLQPGENEHVKNRGQEVKAVGEWCYQEGGELINHLMLHAKGCLRKLDAVQDMLKAQEDQHDNDGASADSGAFDERELPFRDVEKPKRIIEVVHSKALELEGTINEHLADLTAAAHAAQAAKQDKCTHVNGAHSALEHPFTAALELQQSLKLLEQRLLHQRSVLRSALSPAGDADTNPCLPSLSPFRAFPTPDRATSPPITPSIRPTGSSGGLPTPQRGASRSSLGASRSPTPLSTPSRFANPWLPQPATTGDVFSPAFVSAQRRSPASVLSPSPSVAKGDVGRTVPANPTYVGHANLIRTMVSRSSYKKAVYTSEESPETVRLFVSACMSPWGSAPTRSAERAPAVAPQQASSSGRLAPAGSAQSRQTTSTPSAPGPGVSGTSTPASAAAAAALARVSATPNEQSTLSSASRMTASLAQGASAEGRLPSAATSASVRHTHAQGPAGVGAEASRGETGSALSSASAAFSAALDAGPTTGGLVPTSSQSQQGSASIFGAPSTSGLFGATASLFGTTSQTSSLALQTESAVSAPFRSGSPALTAPSLLFGSGAQADGASAFGRPLGLEPPQSPLPASGPTPGSSAATLSLSTSTQSLFSSAPNRQVGATSPFSMPFAATQAATQGASTTGTLFGQTALTSAASTVAAGAPGEGGPSVVPSLATAALTSLGPTANELGSSAGASTPRASAPADSPALQPPAALVVESPAAGLASGPAGTAPEPAARQSAEASGGSTAPPSSSSLSAPSSAAQASQEVADSSGDSDTVAAQGSADTAAAAAPQSSLAAAEGASQETASSLLSGLSFGASQPGAASAAASTDAPAASAPATSTTTSTSAAFPAGPLTAALGTGTAAASGSVFSNTSSLFGALPSASQPAGPASGHTASSLSTAGAASATMLASPVLTPASGASLFPPQAAQVHPSSAASQPSLLFSSASSTAPASAAAATASSASAFGAVTFPGSQPSTGASIFAAPVSSAQSSSLGLGSLASSMGSASLFGAGGSSSTAPAAANASSPFSQGASEFGAPAPAQAPAAASASSPFTAFGGTPPPPTSLFPPLGGAAAPGSSPFGTTSASAASSGSLFSSFGASSGASAFAGGFGVTSAHTDSAPPAAAPPIASAFGQPAQLGSSITSTAFGVSASPGFGQPPQLGGMLGGAAAQSPGFGFGQVAQPHSVFGAPQAPQAAVASPPSSAAPAFGTAFSSTGGGGGGGFAALSQNASSAVFGGGGGFAFGGGSPFVSNPAFGSSQSPFGQTAAPLPPAFSSSAASPGVNAGMFAPRR